MALQQALHLSQVVRHLGRAEPGLAVRDLSSYLRQLGACRADHLERRATVALDVLGEKGDSQTPAPGHLSPVHFL